MNPIWLIIAFQVLLVIAMVFLVFRLALIMIFAHAYLPFLPSSIRVKRALAKSGVLAGHKRMVDLGSGTGTLLIAMHTASPDAKIVGVERSRLLATVSRVRTAAMRPRPTVITGDMFKHNVHEYDLIIGFWITALMPRLLKKFEEECAPGAVIVSKRFRLPPSEQFTESSIHVQGDKIWVYTS